MLRGRALYPTAAKQYLDENAATIRCRTPAACTGSTSGSCRPGSPRSG
jgi:hypothetical protein